MSQLLMLSPVSELSLKREETPVCDRCFDSAFDGRVSGTLGRCGGCPRLGKMVLDLVADPLHQNAEHVGIRWATLPFLCEINLEKLGCELESVINENEKRDEIQQDTRDREQLSSVVFRVGLFIKHGGGQRRHQRHEQGSNFEAIELSETLSVGTRQNLRHDGKRDQMRDAGDRQRAVEEVGAKDEEGNGGLPRDDDGLPVPTTIHSVGAIEESRRLERPALLVGKVLDRNSDESDEEKEHPTVDETHEDDQDADQRPVVAPVTLEGRVHRPVLVRHVDLIQLRRVVHVDAEEDAQRRLQHRHQSDVPDDHERQHASLLQETRRRVAPALQRFRRPEHDPEGEHSARDDTRVDDERQRRRLEEQAFRVQTQDRTSNPIRSETTEKL